MADVLIAAVKAAPATTMPELAERFPTEHGVTATPAMLSRFLCQRGFTHEKALMAAERGCMSIPEERHEWRTKRQPLMRAAR